MRSITTEIYEELNKIKGPMGINRTDVLMHVMDLFMDAVIKQKCTFIDKTDEFHNDTYQHVFDMSKNEYIDQIKKSYSNKDKL